MGGVLFIDEAYYLYRPENERDYGQEAIEILLQVMENHRDDLVVILAGYKDRMDTFFRSNPGIILAHRAPPGFSGLRAADDLLHRRRDARAHALPASDAGPARVRANTSRGAQRSRISPMRARCAMRWTARGCARRAACSPHPESSTPDD